MFCRCSAGMGAAVSHPPEVGGGVCVRGGGGGVHLLARPGCLATAVACPPAAVGYLLHCAPFE